VGKYTPLESDLKRDVNNFILHPATGDQAERYDDNRLACMGLARVLRGNCPVSRELSLALTKLEEAMLWANAAIARNEDTGPPQPST
jgi:hypothetical protein